MVPVPTAKINVDDNNKITTIEVQWYVNQAGNFIIASEDDLDALIQGNITGFSQFGLSTKNDLDISFVHGVDLNEWNATYNFSDQNIDIDEVRDIMVSFAVGEGYVNHKYEFR